MPRAKAKALSFHTKPSQFLTGVVFLLFVAEIVTVIWIGATCGYWALALALLWLGLCAAAQLRFWQRQRVYHTIFIRSVDEGVPEPNGNTSPQAFTIAVLDLNKPQTEGGGSADSQVPQGNLAREGRINQVGKIGALIIFVNWRTFSGQVESIALAYDNCLPDDWCALQIWLNHTNH